MIQNYYKNLRSHEQKYTRFDIRNFWENFWMTMKAYREMKGMKYKWKKKIKT